jgi:hypothetical protein
MMQRAVLAILIGLTVATASAGAAESVIPIGDTAWIGDIVLPETTAWPALRDFPQPPEGEPAGGLLAKMAAELPAGLTGEACPFAANVMRAAGFRGKLHMGNIFGPDDDDIVYVGPFPCGEGDVTVVWRHAHDPAAVSSFVLYARVLRVQDISDPPFSTVEVGCCMTTFDIYHIATLADGNLRSVYLHHQLQIPVAAKIEQHPIALKAATELEWSPLRRNPGAGGDDAPISYQAGTPGEVLATYRDTAGKTWRLLAVPRKSPSGVGWTADPVDIQ